MPIFSKNPEERIPLVLAVPNSRPFYMIFHPHQGGGLGVGLEGCMVVGLGVLPLTRGGRLGSMGRQRGAWGESGFGVLFQSEDPLGGGPRRGGGLKARVWVSA